ncbi:MAG: copper resistance protein B [Bacteriovoracaceae bacterium]|nr:copper resistance protein B [Bacteriovoracaceae bacterium]
MKIICIFLLSFGLFAQSPEHRVMDDSNEIEPFEEGFPDYFYKGPSKKVDGLQKYAIEKPGEEMQNFGFKPVHDDPVFGFVYFDRLEERFEDKSDKLLWDITGMVGPKKDQLFTKSEGTYNTETGKETNSQNEILYGHLVDSFWFAQVGYRRDFVSKKDDREFLVISAQGMTAFEFEVDAAAYLEDGGGASAILEAEYSFLITQRSQLIPRFETEVSSEKLKKYNIGAGITGFELGHRITYEIKREFAPYIGASWEKKVFETADLLDDAGEETSEGLFLVGIKMVL